MPAAVPVELFLCDSDGGMIRLGFLNSVRQGRERVRAIARLLRVVRMPRLMFILVDENGDIKFAYDFL